MAVIVSTTAAQKAQALNNKSRTIGYNVQKKEEEWQSLLSPTQYFILRRGGTERPYSSILEGEERPGTYKCAACGTPLFDAKEKFHSGTGWPSFARALPGVEVEAVNPVQANLAGAELRCRACGGHLGDVFNDGYLFVGTPAFTSGTRFCIDGAALVFEPSDGSAVVRGDRPPTTTKEASLPEWLEPPKITPS
jgi:peptide-methionine (R)-S-oxide reductase